MIGPGSCQGDSGGPLYVKSTENGKIRLVLLGITSKGHSKIGNCGGINNPTHYVRIQNLIWWIEKYIKRKRLCFIKFRASNEVNNVLVDKLHTILTR